MACFSAVCVHVCLSAVLFLSWCLFPYVTGRLIFWWGSSSHLSNSSGLMVDAWCHWRCVLCCTIVSFIWRGPHEVPICVNCVCMCECVCVCPCECVCVPSLCGTNNGQTSQQCSWAQPVKQNNFSIHCKISGSSNVLSFNVFSVCVLIGSDWWLIPHTHKKKDFALKKSQICYTMHYSHRRINVDTCWICRQ